MKRTPLRNGSFMLLIALSLVAAGCSSGGGSTGSPASPPQTLTLAYDTDKDGMPDVFDDYPDDAAGYGYTAYTENDPSVTYFTAPCTFKGTLSAASGTNYFAVRLEGGRTYSLVFYDPEKMNGRAVTFVPDVTVSTVSDQNLPLELSVAGDARVITLSFTPKETDIYYIALQSALTIGQDTSYWYRFDLIEDAAKKGMGVLFKAADGSGYTYTHEDIILLRSSLRPYVKEWANDGTPKAFKDGAANAFAETINYLARVHAADTPCSAQTSLDPYVSDIPWNTDYAFGYGIDAATGFPANQLQAVASFTPPAPTNESTSTDTRIYFIKTDEDYSREIQTGSDTKFSYLGTTYKASLSYAQNIRYSETETTLIVKYYLKEIDYRKYSPNDARYTLTDAAKTYLSAHKDDFRNQYGDYFIAGARYGAQYIATIHIKATSAEEIRTTEAKISVAAQNFDNTETFKAAFRDATKNCSIDFRRITQGGDPTVLQAGTTVDQIFEDVNRFIKSVTKDNRAPLDAYMYRYNQIQDASAIPTEINVNSCVFAKMRDLSQDYLALTSRAKVIAGLDVTQFQAGIQDAYAQEYRTLTNEIRDNRQAICRDLDQITAYGIRVKAAKDKFSNLIDRFSFYQKLVAAARSFPSSTGGDNIARGFTGYNLSVAVDNDIQKTSWTQKYEESWHVGWRTWFPYWAPGTDYRVCFIQIWSWAHSDSWWDQHYPSLGSDHLDFEFKSGYDRGGDWQVQAKGVYLGANGVNYPFMWIH
ncbi:MAG: hypothetical protein ACYDAA_15135 [Syntrophales bacterium]